jgi:hypothetical protein
MRIFIGIAVAALAGLCAAAAPALAQSAPDLRVQADVVSSAANGPGVQGAICVSQSVFFPGSTVIFRAVVSDANGNALTGDQLTARGVKVVATTGEGATVPLVYELHPPPNIPAPARENYFAAAYHISDSHPTGMLPWTLTVTDNQGHTLKFKPIGDNPGNGVLQIAAKAAPAAK